MKDKTVLVCGYDGYIGHALTLRLLKKGYKVVGIDDFRRRYYVEDIMQSFSAMPISTPEERIKLLQQLGDFKYLNAPLDGNYDKITSFINSHKPDVIVNLAQQPSAPFSQISRDLAVETTIGNLIGTINMLYILKDVVPNAHLIQIGSMGEYNPAVGIDIPEGTYDITENIKAIFPRSPGSFYHASKVASTYYMDCACRFWKTRATDIMQGVVYGNWTPEIDELKFHTRLDSDESFGTVVNRFIVQAILNMPLSIYGNGLHKRGFLALNDSIQCLMLAIENEPDVGEYRTWNQLDTIHSMVEVADNVSNAAVNCGIIKPEYNFIETPRAESTDDFVYNPIVEKLKKLGFVPTRTIEQEAEYIFKELEKEKENLFPLENNVEPKIKW